MRYDAREKALRDQQWAIAAAHQAGEQEGIQKGIQKGIEEGIEKGKAEGKAEGEINGKIELIRVLEGLLNRPAMDEAELSSKSLDELSQIAGQLQSLLRSRSNT